MIRKAKDSLAIVCKIYQHTEFPRVYFAERGLDMKIYKKMFLNFGVQMKHGMTQNKYGMMKNKKLPANYLNFFELCLLVDTMSRRGTYNVKEHQINVTYFNLDMINIGQHQSNVAIFNVEFHNNS